MPPLVAIVPALITTIVSFAISAIVGLVTQALTKKPKRGPIFDQRTLTVRQPIEPQQVIIGEARVGGTLDFMDTDGADVWMVVVWTGHQVHELGDVYLDDEQVEVYADGEVAGTHNTKLFVYHHLGADDQAADANLMAAFPTRWTADHVGAGVAYSVFRFVDLPTNFKNAVPNVSCDVRGAILPDPRTGLETYSDNPALAVRWLLLDDEFGLAAEAIEIDESSFIADANLCEEFIDVTGPRTCFAVPGVEIANVNTTNDRIELVTVGLNGVVTGSPVTFASTGSMMAPLVAGTTYYAIETADANSIQVAATEGDALLGTEINLTTSGSGTRTMYTENSRLTLSGIEATFTADTVNDVLIMTPDLRSGGSYKRCRVESTATLPSPLSSSTEYYLDSAGGLALTPGGSAINLTSSGSGTHSVRILSEHGISYSANTTTDVVTGSSVNRWPTGIAIKIAGSGTPAEPLNTTDIYYWIADPISNVAGRLASSQANALSGKAIDLTTTGSGSWGLGTVSYLGPFEMQGLTTGTKVRFETVDGLPTPLVADTDYYWIRRGRLSGQVASTLADALAGTNIFLTDGGGSPLAGRILRQAERRYTCNGAFDADQDRGEVLRRLLASCAGMIKEPLGTGTYRIQAGAYRVPLHALGTDDVRQDGEVRISTRLPRRDAVNTVKGTYISPLNFDQAADFPTAVDADALAEDGDETLFRDIELPFTNSKTMAERLAFIELRRSRAQRTVTFPCSLSSSLKIEVGDSVSLTWPPLGWVDRTFAVAGWTFELDTGDQGAPLPVVDLTLRETDPGVYR